MPYYFASLLELKKEEEMIFSARLMNQRVGYANLNEGALWWETKNNIDPELRVFADPDIAHQMEEEYHAYLNLDLSYGGWMEDRSCIRRGTYLEKDKLFIHTGIDVNANAGTNVYAVGNGPIVYTGTDHPLVGGWGGHVIQLINFRGKRHALIYAHLGEIACLVGEESPRQLHIGAIGDKSQNGFWRPHLHLQLFADVDDISDWDKFSKEMDGYVKEEDVALWARKCPDPTPLIFGVS